MMIFSKDIPDYEKIYSSKFRNGFKLDRVLKPEQFKDLKEYKVVLEKFFKEKSLESWNTTVQTIWLIGQFQYKRIEGSVCRGDGSQKEIAGRIAFSSFCKNYIGIEHYFLTNSNSYYNKLRTYFGELFPNFYKDNPFKNPEKYKFPFKNLTIDHLFLVYQMPERMDILNYVDEKNLRFGEFLDFVINYIGKCNDVAGKEVFQFYSGWKRCPPYVKSLKLKELKKLDAKNNFISWSPN